MDTSEGDSKGIITPDQVVIPGVPTKGQRLDLETWEGVVVGKSYNKNHFPPLRGVVTSLYMNEYGQIIAEVDQEGGKQNVLVGNRSDLIAPQKPANFRAIDIPATLLSDASLGHRKAEERYVRDMSRYQEKMANHIQGLQQVAAAKNPQPSKTVV